jgi:hypothetical protein
MPLMKFHLFEGRSLDEINLLLEVVHEVMVRSFHVPSDDRYQIVSEHAKSHMRALDTGLNLQRTPAFVLLEVVSRPRSRAEKIAFYNDVCMALEDRCGIAPSDVMISFTENTDEDWSFGKGRAQFLTGEL